MRDALSDLADRWEHQTRASLCLAAGDLNVEWSDAEVGGVHIGSRGPRLPMRTPPSDMAKHRSSGVGAPLRPPLVEQRPVERETTLDYIATSGPCDAAMKSMITEWNNDGNNSSDHAKVTEVHGVWNDSIRGRRPATRTLRRVAGRRERQRGEGSAARSFVGVSGRAGAGGGHSRRGLASSLSGSPWPQIPDIFGLVCLEA